jgi:hypothetical protein
LRCSGGRMSGSAWCSRRRGRRSPTEAQTKNNSRNHNDHDSGACAYDDFSLARKVYMHPQVPFP